MVGPGDRRGDLAPWIALTDPVMDANLMNAEAAAQWEFPFGTELRDATSFPAPLRRAHLAHRRFREQICNSLIGVTLGSPPATGALVGRSGERLTNLMLAIPSLVFALPSWRSSAGSAQPVIGSPHQLSIPAASPARKSLAQDQGYTRARSWLRRLRISSPSLPNILGPLIVIATLASAADPAEAALSSWASHPAPFPELGQHAVEAATRSARRRAFGVSLPASHLLHRARLNLLGDGLRDILGPASTRAAP